MTTELLSTFLIFAKTMNVTSSARQLYVEQSTLSRQMHKLEEQLGVRLFTKNGRVLSLTPAGELLRERAPLLLEFLNQLQTDLKRLDEIGAEEVVRFATFSLTADVFTKFTAHFESNHPAAKTTYFISEPDEVIELINYMQADIAFTTDISITAMPAPEREKFVWVPVTTATPCAAMAPTHPLATRSELKIEDLADQLLVVNFDLSANQNMKNYFEAIKFTPQKLEIAKSARTFRYLVKHQKAVAIMLTEVTRELLDSETVVPLSDRALDTNLCFICRKDNEKGMEFLRGIRSVSGEK